MTVKNISLDLIAPNRLNIRRDVGDVTELADSIRTMGLLEPLVVAPQKDEKPYVLIAGHRRLAAAQLAGVKTAAVLVRNDLTTEAAQIEAMLVENLQRVDISPVEEGQAYKQLLAFDGVTVTDIAKKTGRAAATVKARASLAALPDTVQAKVHATEITLADAMVLAEFVDDPSYADLERALGSYNFQHLATRLRRERQAAAEAAKARKALEKAGVPIIDEPDGFPWRSTEKPVRGSHGLEVLAGDEVRDVTVEEHAACPGHAAYIDASMGGEVYVCLDPQTHHAEQLAAVEAHRDQQHASAPAPHFEVSNMARRLGFIPSQLTAEQLEQVHAALAEAKRVEQVLADAQTTRWEHLDPHVKGDAKAAKDTLPLLLALYAVHEGVEDDLCTALGWEPEDDADSEDYHDWFIARCLAAKPDTVSRMTVFMLREVAEGRFGNYHSSWVTPSVQAWFAYLDRAGYPITPEELARITPKEAGAE